MRKKIIAASLRETDRANESLMLDFDQIFFTFDTLTARMDAAFNFIEVNGKYASALHCESSFFIGKNHFDLFPDKNHQAIFRRVVDCGQPYRAWSIPFIYAHASGKEESYWDWIVHPLKDENGIVTEIVLFLVDVTERVHAEMDRREFNDRYKSIFDAAEIGLAVFTAKDNGTDFICVDLNEVCELMEKKSRNEVIGKSAMELFPSARDNGLLANLQQVWKTGKSIKCSASKYNNGWISRWLKNFVYKLPSGEIVMLFMDVTRQKEIESGLRRAYEDLELKVAASFREQGSLKCEAT